MAYSPVKIIADTSAVIRALTANLLSQQEKLSLAKHIWIGFSGGVDSYVLLHALTQLPAEITAKLRAIHVNHQINKEAANWHRHCQAICNQLEIPLTTCVVSVKKITQESLEASARQARYQAFAAYLQPGDCLLTAHHQMDQAETVLLHLCRGAGVRGLKAMVDCQPFANGFLLRPLLNIDRNQIENYARANQLQWIEDDSNQNLDFDRNFLRHQVLPLLRQKWPKVVANLARSAFLCAGAQDELQAQCLADWAQIIVVPGFSRGSHEKAVSITALQTLSTYRQYQVIRHWLYEMTHQIPSLARLEELFNAVIAARVDANPIWRWQQFAIRRYQNTLYITEQNLPDVSQIEMVWDLSTPLQLPGNLGTLYAKQAVMELGPVVTVVIPRLDRGTQGNITVRFRQGGEHLYYQGHQRELKKLFQQWQVPPWQRNLIPLLFWQGELLAVVGYAISEAENCKAIAAQYIFELTKALYFVPVQWQQV